MADCSRCFRPRPGIDRKACTSRDPVWLVLAGHRDDRVRGLACWQTKLAPRFELDPRSRGAARGGNRQPRDPVGILFNPTFLPFLRSQCVFLLGMGIVNSRERRKSSPRSARKQVLLGTDWFLQ